ncbi:hypothetical protein JCGZ_26705 [Jatropha curcas]|uniref:Uncharacterized protein n=1 Tax=Jatropha curcas TaxID=180498 RepID=A0A067JN92_JATCU|nr:hypothetical protein JCGZ_26705 [Jatropha curcas]
MPSKQKARKSKDGSSSSVPTKKDLASRYKAPFPIYTTEDGKCFTCLTKSSFTGWNAASVWEMLTGKVTLGIGSMAPILTYAARMPIPPYRAHPTDIFRYMDGAFLKKSGLVDEVKDVRQRKGKSPVTSSAPAEEEAEEVGGWKQVLSRVDALQQSQENLQVIIFEMGQQLHTIQNEHRSMARKWMSYFRKQNIEFTPSPPDSPEA